jgi:acetyl esterase/lipase
LATGTRDLFLSNTVRTHIKLREAGVVADLLVYEGMSHGDYLHEAASPESRHFVDELSGFLAQHLRRSSRSATPSVPRMRSARWT